MKGNFYALTAGETTGRTLQNPEILRERMGKYDSIKWNDSS
jgi:hypothetical protein